MRTAHLLVAAVLTAACTSPLDVDLVAIYVSEDVTVTPSEPGLFRVTAVNRSDRRVVWGMGSSSCQLGLVVFTSPGRRHRIDYRGCTDDLVEQGLGPGESRTEEIAWGGELRSDGELSVLPPGNYGVAGIAGEWSSARATVTVGEP